jgi:formylglycine-generating enzyme required for sulfatase activity
VHVGVDARDLPDLVVFKDVDAPWCPEMVVIPAGSFLMGSPDDEKERSDPEGPQHRVEIGYRFALGRYAVTFDEYDHFCAATKRKRPNVQGWGIGRRPVTNVNWHDAQAYVAWLSEATRQHYRLPSEAEWEYACRAGTTTRYAFGDEISERNANFGQKVGKTTEVGGYPPNSWGLHEMHGNVWEWVEDEWHDRYQGAPADGSAWIDKAGAGASRVLRGGSWIINARFARSAYRCAYDPGLRNFNYGFRCARVQS